MLMKNIKGQSALEYLMTYGWAVIAILVVIGLLYWLTSQQSSTQANCGTGFPNMAITASSLTAPGLQLEVVNGTGKALTNVQVGAKFTQGQTVKNAMSNTVASMAAGAASTKAVFTANPATALTPGDVLIDLNVSFFDGTFPQTGTAQCRGKIA